MRNIYLKNINLYPKCCNVFDSLGEAYMVKGEKELAIRNYKKSVEMNPSNKNAKEILHKLTKK